MVYKLLLLAKIFVFFSEKRLQNPINYKQIYFSGNCSLQEFFFFLHVQILIILFKDLSYLPNLSTILQQNGILKHTIPIALNNMKIN